MTAESAIVKSSGNVFADLDLSEPDVALAKAELARRINAILQERGLKQAEAAKILGVDQAKISALSRGRLAGFSTERLFRFLTLLGRDVQIVIHPATPRTGASDSHQRGRIRIAEGLRTAR